MAYIALEKMIVNNPSLYKLVLTASERANQIMHGSRPLVETGSKKPTTIALQEIAQGKVYYEETEEEA